MKTRGTRENTDKLSKYATRRKMIEVSRIVNKFQKFVLAETEKEREKYNLTREQVAVGVALLKKSLPDLSHQQLSGDEDNPANITVNFGGVKSFNGKQKD
tara:strand:+ start:5361 stop:5660 length:300 start_codon:yes stop_codon:yes gene_type:complete